jgi:hypothetical protein
MNIDKVVQMTDFSLLLKSEHHVKNSSIKKRFVISTTFRPTHIVWHSLLSLNCCLILVNTFAFVLHEITKIHLKYSQNASASPRPGLRPWTPLGNFRPPNSQTPFATALTSRTWHINYRVISEPTSPASNTSTGTSDNAANWQRGVVSAAGY